MKTQILEHLQLQMMEELASFLAQFLLILKKVLLQQLQRQLMGMEERCTGLVLLLQSLFKTQHLLVLQLGQMEVVIISIIQVALLQ